MRICLKNSSDFPFTRSPGVEFLLDSMDGGMKETFDKEQIEDICHRNAEKLLVG